MWPGSVLKKFLIKKKYIYIFLIQQHKGSRWLPILGWLHTTHVSNELTVIWSCTPLTQRDAHNVEHQVKLMAFNGLSYVVVI
jgi:hypothetical protein